MNAARLYTPEVLAAAMRLAEFPLRDDQDLRGQARSRACGSNLEVGLALDETGAVRDVGMMVHACAIGQSSAAIFAQGVAGRTGEEIERTRDELVDWLERDGPMPDWPGLALIEPARAHPGRHGAIVLAWQAAARALA